MMLFQRVSSVSWRLVRQAARIVVCSFIVVCGQSQAATPVSLAIHGPSMVYEAGSAEYRAVVSWSDGTRSGVGASWSSSNPGLASVLPFGSFTNLMVGTVGANASVTVSAIFSGPSGTLSASKPVTILDASAFPSVSHTLVKGWNLLGNSIGAPLNVVTMFGDPFQPVAGVTSAVVSVWKWDAVNKKWAYFSPGLTPTQLADTAQSRGFSVLRVVHPGEGYWVNARQAVALPPRSAGSISIAGNSVVKDWNLLATGQQVMPGELNGALGGFLSLWSWDANSQQWWYYAPSLASSGGLKAYTDAQGYLDFVTLNRQLGHGIGFWINSATVNTTSDLAPLGQAKSMFSELRTTVRAHSNDLKSGFLDAQSTRIRNDLQAKVSPKPDGWITQLELMSRSVRMFEDVKNGVTSSYAQQTGNDPSKVRAGRTFFHGSVQVFCFSNDMTTQVTIDQLTSASCRSFDTNYGAFSFAFPYRYQWSPLVMVSPGATSSDYNYQAIKRNRRELWNGSTWVFVDNTQIGATRSGSLSRTYVPGTTHLSTVSLTGNLPPSKDFELDHEAVSLTITRAVQNATTGVYRYSVTGSVASKTAAGASMVTLNLASGSYYDAKEDANGDPLPNSLQAVHVVGRAETSASRFTGTLDLNAFASDADGADYVPASFVFDGVFEDLSAGGVGTFLTGRLTVTLNNLASYRSLQPESASNFLLFDTAFVGTIQAPSRPELRLTAGSSRTGLDAYTINTNYSYGPVSVTGTGTLDTLNTDNSSLTLANQDGVTVVFQPHADAVVSKGGTTLGIIPFGSAIVYFVDGYFESL